MHSFAGMLGAKQIVVFQNKKGTASQSLHSKPFLPTSEIPPQVSLQKKGADIQRDNGIKLVILSAERWFDA